MDIQTILQHYIVCALWSSDDSGGEPLENNYSVEDISANTLQNMLDDVTDFVESNTELLLQSGLSDEQIGHDFWLTRNGHGAGFWDRGLDEIGKTLSDNAELYGEVYLYIGDDGKIYA